MTSEPQGPEPVTVTATDNRPVPGAWTLVSDSFAAGITPPFTGTAVLTSVA